MKGDFFHKAWALGFVRGGMDAVMSDSPLKIDVVRNPYKDRWFADPFVLDVTDTKIMLLVEELRYSHPVGRIAKLTIDRKSMAIEKMDIILECPKHLSFPNIFRKGGKVYVYPENCQSGALNIYEYDDEGNRYSQYFFEKSKKSCDISKKSCIFANSIRV